MNKVILGLILAVCLLGMALVMLNERLGRQTESPIAQNSNIIENKIPADLDFPDRPIDVNPPLAPAAEAPVSPLPSPANALNASRVEEAEAEAALAPPPAPTLREVPKAPAPIAQAPKSAPPISKPVPPLPKAPVEEKAQPEKTVATEKPASEKVTPAIKYTPASDDKNKEKTVNRFVIFSREKGATIRIGAASRIHYNSMTLDNPDRIVVDMDGQWQFPPSPGVPKNEMVSNVRIGKNGDKTRVVIDLKEKARVVRIVPSKNGDSMDIRVDK